MKKPILLGLLSLVFLTSNLFAQNNVGINNPTPNASAALDVTSTTQGMLVPRMTQSQRNAIATPATGLLIYQTDNTPGFYSYNGSAWTSLSGGSSTLPSQTGNGGKVLGTDGTNLSFVSGGAALIDNNGVRLGTVVGLPAFTANSGAYATILTSTGYYATVLFDPSGTNAFPGNQIYWSTAGCTGTPYFNNGGSVASVRLAKLLVYSANTGQLYSLSNPNANGVSTSIGITTATIENSGVCSSNPSGTNGYALTAVSRATAGLPTTIAYPLSIR